SIGEAEAVENLGPGREVLENAVWAQDEGLEQAAKAAGNVPWDRRPDLVNVFKNSARRLIGSVSRNLLAHGVAFSCEYNDTLASAYAAGNGESTLTGSGGVLLRKKGNTARVCGYACDVSVTDGSAQYCISRVVCWG
ncbi:MAG TPA: hypothetical protein VGJ92_06180, partial [Methanocella sp.]